MQDKRHVIREIDAAIDNMDERRIMEGLEALSACESRPICGEDAKEFAARIQNLSGQKLNKERTPMKKPFKMIPAAVAAALVLVMGLTVYAAAGLKIFSFQQDGKLITIRTTGELTEQEARDMAEDSVDASAQTEEAAVAEEETYAFSSVQQAEKEMDMKIPMPVEMPDMQLADASGAVYSFGDGLQQRIVWLNYADESQRMFGVTVTRRITANGIDVTGISSTDIDEGSLGTYKSKSGVSYTTLAESDDTGEKTAQIAVAAIGEYEYALVFVGFEEDDRLAVIDSVDLTVYGGGQ